MKGEDIDEMPTLHAGDWEAHPSGLVSLSEEAFKTLLNTEPIDNVYVLDPEPIARGQFAVVYHCTHRITGKEYAAKFSSRVRLGADCSHDLIHEVAISIILRSTPTTIHLVDVFSTDSQLILVMEYAPGGDLQTLLDENIVPYENDVIKFMRQLLEGLAFIHERNLVHLDIKPQNLVLMGEYPNCAVKLCDFEISRMLIPGSEIREILGTPDYVAPEILHYEPITTRTDMWSVGVLTYVLLTGFLPFGGESDQETFVEILKGEVDFPTELFEDVTPDAIDFIKKLLIKQPEKRMSAKESLNHSWMTAGRQRRPTPPSTLNLTSPLNSQISSTPAISVLQSNIFSPVEGEVKTHPVLTKSPSDGSNIIDICLALKNNARPPLHPTSSQKSLLGECLSVAGTPVTTPGITLTSPFIYRQESRFGSRHNLDKLRSLSKSREVLSEKVQMSKLKKSMSKSRERLYDSRLGMSMSKSREKLMSLSSLSQSVEVLSALSHLAQNNLYQSCNNIFVTKPGLPDSSGNLQERMYQSMAAIDQIGNLSSLQKIGYFESRMSLDSEDYNDIITQRNTDMNCFLGGIQFDKPLETKTFGGLRGNSCIGGRGDTCDNRCSRHLESNDNQKSTTKVNKTEKLKRDAQKRRKDKRERERRDHLKKEKEKKENEKQKNFQNLENDTLKQKLTDSPPSPSFRRGSVSHVEQRLQERHERNQERMEREREGKRNKRRVSADQDRFNSHERFKTKTNTTLQVPNQRSRSNTPTRRKSRKESPFGSDLSQTSSMESVNTSTDKTLTDLKKVANDLNTNNEDLSVDDVMNPELEVSIEPDEAYVSLEDTSLEAILMRSKSTESASSEDSEKTVVDSCKERNSSSSDDEPGIETLSVSEKIFGFEKGIIGVVKKAPPLIKQKSLSDMTEKNMREQELPVITEETSPLSSPPTVRRSVSNISNTSDFGSLISENSDYASEKESPSTPSEFQTGFLSPDWKGRARSLSVYSSPSPPLSSPRSRSNSFNFDVPENPIARPWGNVCSGSVARAFEKFNIRSTESPDPKNLSSPAMSPCGENLQQLIA